MIIYGMGENPLRAVALRLEKGERIEEIRDVAGTTVKEEIECWRRTPREDCLVIPSFTEVSTDKRKYAQAFALHYREQDPFHGRAVVQPHPKTVIIQNPPARPLRTEELGPHLRAALRPRGSSLLPGAHPCLGAGPLLHHQPPGLLRILLLLRSDPPPGQDCAEQKRRFHPARGDDAHEDEGLQRHHLRMWAGRLPTCTAFPAQRWKQGACSDKLCSADCPTLDKDHSRQVDLLRRLRKIPGVKRVFIGSGIRHDLIMADHSPYLEELCRHHVSGHLKIAPEHISRSVTECMHKPAQRGLGCLPGALLRSHPGSRKGAVPSALSHVRPSRLHCQGHGRAG